MPSSCNILPNNKNIRRMKGFGVKSLTHMSHIYIYILIYIAYTSQNESVSKEAMDNVQNRLQKGL